MSKASHGQASNQGSSPRVPPSPGKLSAISYDKKGHVRNLERERIVRAGLALKIQKAEREDDMKPLKYRGGKVLYRSVQQPLKLYAHGMRIVDITNPNN